MHLMIVLMYDNFMLALKKVLVSYHDSLRRGKDSRTCNIILLESRYLGLIEMKCSFVALDLVCQLFCCNI
jgi:hypothetical protein